MRKLWIGLASAAVVVAVAFGIAWALRSYRSASQEGAPFANPSKDVACSKAVSQLISESEDCDKKLVVLSRNIGKCGDQYIMIEEPEPYETVFADEAFEVARCFETRGDLVKARSALELALANKDWQMNGPASCAGHATAHAEIEALDRKNPANCVAPAALANEVRKLLPNLKPEALEAFLGHGTVLSAGSYESDDVCPLPVADMKSNLEKALASAPKDLQILEHQPAEDGDRFLIGAPGSNAKDPWLVLDFVPANGCSHLSQVLVAPTNE